MVTVHLCSYGSTAARQHLFPALDSRLTTLGFMIHHRVTEGTETHRGKQGFTVGPRDHGEMPVWSIPDAGMDQTVFRRTAEREKQLEGRALDFFSGVPQRAFSFVDEPSAEETLFLCALRVLCNSVMKALFSAHCGSVVMVLLSTDPLRARATGGSGREVPLSWVDSFRSTPRNRMVAMGGKDCLTLSMGSFNI